MRAWTFEWIGEPNAVLKSFMPVRIGEFTVGQLVSLRFPAMRRQAARQELEAGLFPGPRKRKDPRPAGTCHRGRGRS